MNSCKGSKIKPAIIVAAGVCQKQNENDFLFCLGIGSLSVKHLCQKVL